MAPGLVIIGKVASQDVLEMRLVQDNYVIQALAPYAADQPLDERILPRRAWRRGDFFNPQVLHATMKSFSVSAVAVMNQITWSCVEGEGLSNLACNPFGRWMPGHIEMDDAAAIMAKNNKAVEQLESHGRHDEEVNGRQTVDVVLEERPPRLRWRFAGPPHVLGDSGLGDVVPEEVQLGLNAAHPTVDSHGSCGE